MNGYHYGGSLSLRMGEIVACQQKAPAGLVEGFYFGNKTSISFLGFAIVQSGLGKAQSRPDAGQS